MSYNGGQFTSTCFSCLYRPSSNITFFPSHRYPLARIHQNWNLTCVREKCCLDWVLDPTLPGPPGRALTTLEKQNIFEYILKTLFEKEYLNFDCS